VIAAPAKLAVRGQCRLCQAHILFDVALTSRPARRRAHRAQRRRQIDDVSGDSGLVANRSGTIVFDGENVSALPTYDIVRRVSDMFQRTGAFSPT